MIPAPRDPRWLLGACSGYGLAVAQGVLERQDALAGIYAQVRATGHHPDADRRSLRGRIIWGLDDAVRDWSRRRQRIAADIKRAVAPLMDDWAEPPAILARAHEINGSHRRPWTGPLLAHEIRALVAEEMQWRLRARGRARKRSRHVG